MPSNKVPDVINSPEDNFRVLFDENPLPTILSEMPSGIIAFANKRMAAILGMKHGDIIGRTANDLGLLKNPADQEKLTALIGSQGFVDNMEVEKLYLDGSHGIDLVSMRLVTVNGKLHCLTVIQDITERNRMEDALRKSEERYRRLVETTDTGYVIVDTKGIVLDANQEYIRLSGHEKLEEILGRAVVQWTADEEKETNERAVAACMKTGYIRNLEITYVDKTGKRTPVEINATVMETEGTQKILSLCRDISERRKMEAALRESEEKFSKAFKTSPDSININRLSDGMYLEINPGFTAITGYAPEDVLGRSSLPGDLGIWVHKEDRDRLVAGLKANGEVIGLEAPFRTKNGKTLIGSMSARIMEINGEACILSATRDITSQKRAEEEIRRSKETLELIFKTGPDAVSITRMSDGLMVDINERFTAISGYNRDEIVGRTSVELNFYADPESRRKIVECLAKNGYCENFETLFRTKSGSQIIGLMSSQVISLNGASHVYSILRDITEIKKTESLLMNAQKLDSLGVLAGGIAHDFNNLLTGIFGYISLARSVSKETKAIEYLETTIATMNRARSLTQQLLTFAKGGAPVQKITPLVPFIQEAVHFALSGSNISCRFSLSENLWACNIDKNQIGQVLDNIVINAQQAMPNGGTIDVTVENVSLGSGRAEHPSLANGDYVKVSIQDFGIGIPKDILPRIFDPFYTTKTKGHGLGLATCYSIVNRHGGCIDVDSEPGKGSTFHVYLPASTESVESKTVTVVNHKGSGTILVMDDEEVIRTTVGEMLQSLGYAVICKSNGQETLAFFQSETGAGHIISALLFDLTIAGGMGGIDAAAGIRKLNKDIPIFVMSGYADNLVIKNPAGYGFTASISKPFTIAELSEMLSKNL
jgi:two-component system, cell cycle sensor histidine kinase and response regulator CckA